MRENEEAKRRKLDEALKAEPAEDPPCRAAGASGETLESGLSCARSGERREKDGSAFRSGSDQQGRFWGSV